MMGLRFRFLKVHLRSDDVSTPVYSPPWQNLHSTTITKRRDYFDSRDLDRSLMCDCTTSYFGNSCSSAYRNLHIAAK
jgi:hypothetical protein